MRLAPLAALWVLATVTARVKHDWLCVEAVCFYHTPKTGGDSFKNLFKDGQKHQQWPSFWSNEWCPGAVPRCDNQTDVVLFREPRAHVLSQYFECRDSPWGRTQTDNTSFPRQMTKGDPYAGFKAWVQHFAAASDPRLEMRRVHGQMKMAYPQIDFGCYDPRNMQARYATCTCERNCAHHLVSPKPTKARAAAGLAALDVVGLIEHFDASVCLVMDAAGIELPDACFCDSNASLAAEVVNKPPERYHIAHGVHRHSPDDLDAATLRTVDALTALDRHVYKAARKIFFRDVSGVEARLGRKMLSD